MRTGRAFAAAVVMACVTAVPVAAQPADPVQAGKDALKAEEYDAAREAFTRALTADAKSVDAAHGLALVLYWQKQLPKAVQQYDKALALPGAAQDRALAINAAAAYAETKNYTRALKTLRDYLAAKPQTLDEPLVQALECVIAACDDQAKRGKVYQDAVAAADQAAKRLEAARPGYKRWGRDWIPAAEAARYASENESTRKQLQKIEADVENIDRQLAGLRRDRQALEYRVRRGFDPQYMLDSMDAKIQDLNNRRDQQISAGQRLTDNLHTPAAPDDRIAAVAMGTPAPEFGPITPPAPPVPQDAPPEAHRPRRPGRGPATRPADAGEDPPIVIAPPERSLPSSRPNRGGGVARPVDEQRHAAGFAVTADQLIAPLGVVAGAKSVDVTSAATGRVMKADVVRVDAAAGIAVLRVKGGTLTPVAVTAEPYAGGAVKCVTFPSVDLFQPIPEALAGTSTVVGGKCTVKLDKPAKLAGAPLLVDGRVVGVALGGGADAVDVATAASIRSLLAGESLDAPAAPADVRAFMLYVTATHDPAKP
jgi:tetratricopeptide (TPR) repeat protein